MSTAFLITVNLSVHGQSLNGVSITQFTVGGLAVTNISPEQTVTLGGIIETSNGPYQIYIENTVLASGNANGFNVLTNFTVPFVVSGPYQFTLVDVTTGNNATYPESVFVTYNVEPVLPASPGQVQEGSSLPINVSIVGGDANKQYVVELVVVPPSGVEGNYTTDVSLTTSSLGYTSTIVTFPSSNFNPAGSTTYFGTYNVYLNATQSLAQTSFNVGFTDFTEYHRGGTVKINGLGYQPSQSASIAIKLNDNVVFTQTVAASSQGAVSATWPVPSDASLGNYSVAITPLTTPSKLIADEATFLIAGYPVTFKAVNLANEVVPQIAIEALDQASGSTYTGTTDSNGIATINLEKGAVTATAFWNDAQVAQIQLIITGANTYTVSCKLTDLKIKVQDKTGVVIPFVQLNITYSYVSRAGTTITSNATAQTDLTGTCSFNSLLTGIGYTVLASKYNTVFNTGNTQIGALPAQASTQFTILCPDETLTLKTVDYNFATIANARITLIEQASGLFYSVTTDSNGNAQLDVTFGQYRAEIYTSSNLLLNTTILSVLSNTDTQIRCVTYNLPFSVKVVDYFGNGIGNIKIQISRPGMDTLSATTQGDGTAAFGNIIGGNMEITAYPTGKQNSFVATNLQVNSAAAVKLTMQNYVVIAGALISTSTLATIIIIVLALLVFIGIEVYRRTGFKLGRKTEG